MKFSAVNGQPVAAHDNPKAQDLMHQGRLFTERGHHTLALECFETILRQKPNDLDAQMGRCFNLIHMGATKQAQESLDQLLNSGHTGWRAHFALGELLLMCGDAKRALSHYQSAVHDSPLNASTEHGCGLALTQLNRHEEALEHFSRALENDPHHFDALLAKGHTLRFLRRSDEALQCFEHALEIHPYNDTAYFGRRATMRDLGMPISSSYAGALD